MSPRDRYLTVHGRKPVLEALQSNQKVAKIHMADRQQGDVIDQILDLARKHDVPVERVAERRVTAVARSGQHQGVVADVAAPRMQSLMSFLEQRTGRNHATTMLVLDRIHNPANLGMILRSATAAGIDGIVVPERYGWRWARGHQSVGRRRVSGTDSAGRQVRVRHGAAT